MDGCFFSSQVRLPVAMFQASALTVLRREPPSITTDEFLESLAFCVHDWKDTTVSRWHRFDTYQTFPVTKEELFEWFQGFREMKHTAFTVDSFLTSLNVWFQESSGEENEVEVVHPESFLMDAGRLQGFLEQHCHSPSLLQAGFCPKPGESPETVPLKVRT